jgi:hypothetical protein
MASLALVALGLAGSLTARQSLVYAQVPGRQPAVVKHRHATPELTGSDGSQTGIAAFLGNFTTSEAPNGQVIALYRTSDCSLTLVTGTYNIGPGTSTQTGDTPNYERLLHSEAGLTTTPDVFPSKCAMEPIPVSAPGQVLLSAQQQPGSTYSPRFAPLPH